MAASWKAMSEESTGWDWPSLITQRVFTTGKPRRLPFSVAALKPFSQLGMNSLGMAAPLIMSTKSKFLSSQGSM